MKRKLQGKYVTTTTVGETVRAFVPASLPPRPDIEWSAGLRQQFEKAHLALGRLDSLCRLLPDTGIFLYAYVRKEAVLSSMIEGTQSSLSDLLMYELDQQPGVPMDDVEEVSNYVAAMEHGLKRLQEGFPLSVRLFREMHRELLAGGRGSHKQPGELRKTQNWIGGTRPGNATFVPPPPDRVADAMAVLEMFIHDEGQQTSTLLKAALVHVQFETIHPFLDGNGRLGRLLITLLLVSENVLQQPLLYLSLYFKTHRQAYYDHLNQIRQDGDWESWLQFFAEAVEHTANDAVQVAQLLMEQSERDAALVQEQGRYAGTLARLHSALLKRPLTTAAWLKKQTGLANATVQSGLQRLIDLGLLHEKTGKQRDRVYAYQAYIDILNRGNELP
jgi:Fic family protein